MFLYQNVRNVMTIFQSRFALEEIAPDLSSSRDEFGTFLYVIYFAVYIQVDGSRK